MLKPSLEESETAIVNHKGGETKARGGWMKIGFKMAHVLGVCLKLFKSQLEIVQDLVTV